MTFVVTSNKKYIVFERFVRDMDILTTAEETSYINLATEFDSEQDAKDFIKIANDSGYDVSGYGIADKDKIIKDKEAAEENAKLESKRKHWQRLSEDDKRAYLSTVKENELKKFLEDMNESSTMLPMTKEELAMRRIHKLEKDLGITFTPEQIEILKNKEA